MNAGGLFGLLFCVIVFVAGFLWAAIKSNREKISDLKFEIFRLEHRLEQLELNYKLGE